MSPRSRETAARRTEIAVTRSNRLTLLLGPIQRQAGVTRRRLALIRRHLVRTQPRAAATPHLPVRTQRRAAAMAVAEAPIAEGEDPVVMAVVAEPEAAEAGVALPVAGVEAVVRMVEVGLTRNLL